MKFKTLNPSIFEGISTSKEEFSQSQKASLPTFGQNSIKFCRTFLIFSTLICLLFLVCLPIPLPNVPDSLSHRAPHKSQDSD